MVSMHSEEKSEHSFARELQSRTRDVQEEITCAVADTREKIWFGKSRKVLLGIADFPRALDRLMFIWGFDGRPAIHSKSPKMIIYIRRHFRQTRS